LKAAVSETLKEEHGSVNWVGKLNCSNICKLHQIYITFLLT